MVDFETMVFQNDKYFELIQHIIENQNNLPDLKVEDGCVYKRVDFDRGYVRKSLIEFNCCTRLCCENVRKAE